MEIKQIPHPKDKIITKVFGQLPNGQHVHQYELTNSNGMQMHLIDYGATLTALQVPLQDGSFVDVVLGFDTLDQYIRSFSLPAAPYFGATVGRFAGRIANGVFNLNDRQYQLTQNNNTHALHGGTEGFSQKVWTAATSRTIEGTAITFTHLSPDNEEFFPGSLEVKITYILTEANEVKIRYIAVADNDTIINLTHHSYFNLDGQHAAVSGQQLFVNAAFRLETDQDNIPTGRFLNLEEQGALFNPPKPCPAAIDDTFILPKNASPAASLISTSNALRMDIYTDQPAVHIYIGGNCFNTIKGKQQADYHTHSGICFETQNFPDAPNHEHFPSAVLKKGAVYQQQTLFKFENTAS